MARWWLVDGAEQDRLAHYIGDAAQRAIANMDSHGNEEQFTSALGQELQGDLNLGGGKVAHFWYRTLNKQTEEPKVGADGGFVVSVTTPQASSRKGVLFQAKLFKDVEPTRSHSLTGQKAAELRVQTERMLHESHESVGVFYTRRNVYVVDADVLQSRSDDDLRTPLAKGRIVSLSTYLGRWVARCVRGDPDQGFLRKLEHQGGFRQLIGLDVRARDL